MNQEWQDFLATAGAVPDATSGQVQHFGDAAAELAARNATVLAPLNQLGLIACSGDDADEFLHNQVTNDIKHLGADSARLAAWCTAKGRMLASFIIFRQEGGLQISLAAELVPTTLKRLQMFVLRAKVKLADLSGETVTLGLAGPQAVAALEAARLAYSSEVMGIARNPQATVVTMGEARFHLFVQAAAAPSLWTELAALARPVGLPVWQHLEITAGYPLITEATKEAFVPQMADFDRLGGISFTKGCYPGQEIVARTKYLGKVKRHLFRLQSPVALVAGEELYSPESDQEPAKVVTAAPNGDGSWSALAVVLAAQAGSLHAQGKAGPAVSANPVFAEEAPAS